MAARYGSDLVVDLLKVLGIEYVALNPGSSFRGIHDSLVNYESGRQPNPEMILCCHEEIAVAVAHGYAKATGKIMPAIVHNVVGLQHASMAIYNAWCDHTPVMVMGGTGPMNSSKRRPWIDWIHTAQVQGNLVRDFVKWDDQPVGVEAFPSSIMRGYRIAMSDPGRAGLPLLRRHRSGGRDRKRNPAARSEPLPSPGAAASGLRRDQRSGAVTRLGAKSGDLGRLRRAQ